LYEPMSLVKKIAAKAKAKHAAQQAERATRDIQKSVNTLGSMGLLGQEEEPSERIIVLEVVTCRPQTVGLFDNLKQVFRKNL